MFKNFFKTTIRSLWKNKGYSFLNIFGLAIGITCAGLIALITVSFQAIKAAVANPVESLRSE